MKIKSEVVIDIPEVARRLGISKAAAYGLARAGKIPVLRLGRTMRVPVAAFNALLETATVGRDGTKRVADTVGEQEQRIDVTDRPPWMQPTDRPPSGY